jgi:hypothetical protein
LTRSARNPDIVEVHDLRLNTMKIPRWIGVPVMMTALATAGFEVVSARAASYFSQASSTQESAPAIEPTLTGLSIGLGAKWSLAYEFHREAPKTGADAGNELFSFLVSAPEAKDAVQHRLLAAHRNELAAIFDRLKLHTFLYFNRPVAVAQSGPTSTLIIGALASDTVYNTLNSTSRSRAAKVLTATILPALKECGEKIEPNAFNAVGILALYGSKKFVDSSSVLNLKPEALTFIVPTDLLRRFASSQLAEDDLVEKADIYLMDRDSPQLRKIRLTLQ